MLNNLFFCEKIFRSQVVHTNCLHSYAASDIITMSFNTILCGYMTNHILLSNIYLEACSPQVRNLYIHIECIQLYLIAYPIKDARTTN